MYANAHSALAAGGKGASSEPGAAGSMHSCTRPRDSGGSSVSRPTNGRGARATSSATATAMCD